MMGHSRAGPLVAVALAAASLAPAGRARLDPVVALR